MRHEYAPERLDLGPPQQLSAQRFRILDHRHLHDLGDLRFLASEAREVQQPTAEAGRIPDVADYVVQHQCRAIWRTDDKCCLMLTRSGNGLVMIGLLCEIDASVSSLAWD